MNTQDKIINEIDTRVLNHQGRRSTKCTGNAVSRLFMKYIDEELDENGSTYTVSEANTFIAPSMSLPEKFKSPEFDFLIVKKKAKYDPITNEYDANDVRIIFEIKTSGTIVKGKTKEERAKCYLRTISHIETIRAAYPEIEYIYLTFQEVSRPKKADSVNYLKETIDSLDPYKCYCLRDYNDHKSIPDQWDQLMAHLLRVLR